MSFMLNWTNTYTRTCSFHSSATAGWASKNHYQLLACHTGANIFEHCSCGPAWQHHSHYDIIAEPRPCNVLKQVNLATLATLSTTMHACISCCDALQYETILASFTKGFSGNDTIIGPLIPLYVCSICSSEWLSWTNCQLKGIAVCPVS